MSWLIQTFIALYIFSWLAITSSPSLYLGKMSSFGRGNQIYSFVNDSMVQH
jgi:hypothetical protein